MEEYAVLQVSNGNNSVVAEHLTTPESAKVNYHLTCAALWNEPSVITGSVMIVDNCNRLYDGYHEIIKHPTQTPTPTQGE